MTASAAAAAAPAAADKADLTAVVTHSDHAVSVRDSTDRGGKLADDVRTHRWCIALNRKLLSQSYGASPAIWDKPR